MVAYYPGGGQRLLSQWNPSVAAPDLSHVLQWAGQTGTLMAKNDDMDMRIDLLIKKIEKQQAAKKKAAADAATTAAKSSNPGDESFWSKIGDFAKAGLSHTLDALGTGLYADANAMKALTSLNTDEESSFWQKLGGNTLGLPAKFVTGTNVWDSFDEFFTPEGISKVAGAWWKGATHQEHTTFADVIATNGMRKAGNQLADNSSFGAVGKVLTGASSGVLGTIAPGLNEKINPFSHGYQGLGGFVGDVIFDPLSYIGTGLITKPTKKLLEEAAVSGGADGEIAKFAKDAENLKLTLPGHNVPLNAPSIYQMLGGRQVVKGARKARFGKRLSTRAMGVNNVVENFGIIKKALEQHPTIDSSALDHISTELERVKGQYHNLIEKSGSDAFEEALVKVAKKPGKASAVGAAKGLEPTDLATELAGRAKISVKSSTVLKAFNRVFSIKPSHFNNDLVQLEGARNDALNLALGKSWFNDPRISPEFRDGIFDRVDRIVKKLPLKKKITRRQGVLRSEITKFKAELNTAKKLGSGAEPGEVARLEYAIKSRETRILDLYKPTNYAQADTFVKLLMREVGDPRVNSRLSADLTKLEERQAQIVDRLKNIDVGLEGTRTPIVKTSGEQDIARGIPNDVPLTDAEKDDLLSGHDEVRSLQSELKDLQEEMASIIDEDGFINRLAPIDLPEGFPKDVKELLIPNPDGTITLRPDIAPEFRDVAEQIHTSVDLLVSEGMARKLETWRSLMREGRGKARMDLIPPKIRGIFKDNKPTITLEGKALKKGSPEARRAVEKHVKPQDISMARSAMRKALSKAEKDADRVRAKTAERVAEANDDILHGTVQSMPKSTEGLQQLSKELDRVVAEGRLGTQRVRDFTFDRIFAQQHGLSIQEASKTYWQHVKRTLPERGELNPSKEEELQMLKQANLEAVNKVNADIADNKLDLVGYQEVDLYGERITGIPETAPKVEDVVDHTKASVKKDYAQRKADAKLTLDKHKAQDEIALLERAQKEELAMVDEAAAEAIKTRKAMSERMDEQLLLNMIEDGAREQGKLHARITMAGAKVLDVPVPASMLTATEKIGGLPIIQAANKAWAQGFHPSSRLEPELNQARRAMGNQTPNIIKWHVQDILHKFGPYSPHERQEVLRGIMHEAPIPGKLNDEMQNYFDEFLPYVSQQIGIADEPLTVREINHFLPEEFRINSPLGISEDNLRIESTQHLLQSLRNVKHDTDPMQIMWRLRIGTEQALAKKNLNHVIKSTFGIRRTGEDITPEMSDLIETLAKNHGWTNVGSMGKDHYFAPELVDQINKLNDLMEPENVPDLIKGFDKVTRAWKSAVTVYNPGYYIRNGIGEFMMGLVDGVGPRAYEKAARVIGHKKPDEVIEALKSLDPFKKYQTPAQAGARAVIRNRNFTLSEDEAWILFNQSGLKTGFISSEYNHYFPSAGSMKATPVGQVATKINDVVRSSGEHYEDFFRMAHFISRMERSTLKDPVKAAEEAAQKVIKYHFDYTDFTPLEKTTLMRVFPFYKWTRKALPLMASMVFTRPGMITLYPKFMQNLSYAQGGTDALNDPNGFLPNYEKVTPSWMQDLFAYPMGPDESGAQTYMHVATPQLDVLNFIQNPASATIGMLNPIPKTLLEQGSGHSLDPQFSMDFSKIPGSRKDELMRLTPQTAYYNALRKGATSKKVESAYQEPGKSLWDEKTLSFFSGLGFYENNKKRQQGEQLRRNLEASKK